MDYLTQFLKKPRDVGTIAPSSPELAHAMVEWVDWDGADVVAEYGPGTGVITNEILRCLKNGATFFAVEANETFARTFRESFPEVTLFEDSVENIDAICNGLGVEHLDCVVSGLPWASFPELKQDLYLDPMIEKMPDGAQFVTFAYLQGLVLPAARRFRARLDELFTSVETSETVWKNLPPAIVYRCRK